MKKLLPKPIFIGALFFFLSFAQISNAQSLFKDINPGTNGSDPFQFVEVNGTLFFITIMRPSYEHQLWKTDGTVAGTVLVKDNLITTSLGGIIKLINFNNTLYYMLNTNGSSTSATTTEMWKSDGTTSGTVLVTTLTNSNPLSMTGDYPPQNYTVVGNKMFFQFGSGHGLELWVTDGTASGTMEVVDLNPGNNGSGTFYGGVTQLPMASYNGKLYFQGSNTIGMEELYTSDGTAGGTTLILGGSSLDDPKHFINFNNELYFYGNSGAGAGIWKTDGTTVGTVNISTTGFNNDAKIFNNEMYYSVAGSLWKSDGTTGGTTFVKDSVGSITGILDNYFYTSYMRYISVAPYYTMYYWKSDGTISGTERITNKPGKAASFCVFNNKMYNSVADSVGYTSGLWETDGTIAGSVNLLTGYIGYPFTYNSNVFFTNNTSSTGYELWSLNPAANSVNELTTGKNESTVYPNPSTGVIKLDWNGTKNATVQILNLLGDELVSQTYSNEINLSHLPKGVYLVKISDGENTTVNKLILE
jgi:ELWxxDGT repeat protein